MAARREFSRKLRAQIVARATMGGVIICEGCGLVLAGKRYEIDHIVAEALRSADKPLTAEDGRLLGRCCHAPKTADDIRRIRKADRQRDRHTGAMLPSKNPLRGRGFPKKPKRAVPQLPMPPRRRLTPIGGLDAVGFAEDAE